MDIYVTSTSQHMSESEWIPPSYDICSDSESEGELEEDLSHIQSSNVIRRKKRRRRKPKRFHDEHYK